MGIIGNIFLYITDLLFSKLLKLLNRDLFFKPSFLLKCTTKILKIMCNPFVEFIALLLPKKSTFYTSDDTVPTKSFTPGAAPNISEIFLVNNAISLTFHTTILTSHPCFTHAYELKRWIWKINVSLKSSYSCTNIILDRFYNTFWDIIICIKF